MAGRIDQVAALLGLEFEQPFRTSAFVGRYRLTRRGIECWDGVEWFYSDLSALVLEAMLVYDVVAEPEETR